MILAYEFRPDGCTRWTEEQARAMIGRPPPAMAVLDIDGLDSGQGRVVAALVDPDDNHAVHLTLSVPDAISGTIADRPSGFDALVLGLDLRLDDAA